MLSMEGCRRDRARKANADIVGWGWILWTLTVARDRSVLPSVSVI